MKTNNVMKRNLGGFDVFQRTSDGYFDASALIVQWNSTLGNKRKKVIDFLSNSNTKDFIDALLKEDESPSQKNHLGDFQPFIIYKGRNTKLGRTSDKVWMHPLLFIKFSMWLNPSFEVKVLRFVQDQLLYFRDKAGDSYMRMCSALFRIIPDRDRFKEKVKDLARSLNIIVYGFHEKMARNMMSKS